MPSHRCSSVSLLMRRSCKLAIMCRMRACRQPLRLLARPATCVRLACQYQNGALRLRLLLRTLRTGTATCVAGSALRWQLVTSARSRHTLLTSTLRLERCCFRKAVPSQSSPRQPLSPCHPNTSECSFCDGFVYHYP